MAFRKVTLTMKVSGSAFTVDAQRVVYDGDDIKKFDVALGSPVTATGALLPGRPFRLAADPVFERGGILVAMLLFDQTQAGNWSSFFAAGLKIKVPMDLDGAPGTLAVSLTLSEEARLALQAVARKSPDEGAGTAIA